MFGRPVAARFGSVMTAIGTRSMCLPGRQPSFVTAVDSARQDGQVTVTTMDSKAALVVVDLQNGSRLMPTAHSIDGVVGNAANLARAFRAADLPVVLVAYVGGSSGRTDASRIRSESGAPAGTPPADWSELLVELDRQPGDIVLPRGAWGAFHGTALGEILERIGVTQIVLAGIATSLGVESTAREARDRGYNVVLAIDAMTDINPAAHEHAAGVIFPLMGESGTSTEIIELLDARSV